MYRFSIFVIYSTPSENAQADGARLTKSRLESVYELVRIQIALQDELWDSDPYLVACKNGTLHIPSRKLIEHNPDYHLTTALPFDYDPKAQADIFKFVIESSLPDAAGFLQEFAGYALTIDTHYETAVWLFGPPACGKSTIISGFQAMLGNRAGQLGLVDIERSRFGLTSLLGKTLVVSTEQPANFLAATEKLNQIISGETILVDRKFKDLLEINPRAKILWAMNELPRVGAASGLFRRVKVIQLPPAPKKYIDPKIKEAVKNEGAGFLNWALDGYKRLKDRDGFNVPNSVGKTTDDFKSSNDIPAAFVEDICETDLQVNENGGALYMAYKQWCEENGHKPKGITSIAEDWRRLGYKKYMSNGRARWHGVKLRKNIK